MPTRLRPSWWTATVRHGLNKDLGVAGEDRVENIRRVAEVARLMIAYLLEARIIGAGLGQEI